VGMDWLGVRIIRRVCLLFVGFVDYGCDLLTPFIVYINDSLGMVVYAFDFDLESGSISNKRVLVDRRAEGGEPDGAVIE